MQPNSKTVSFLDNIYLPVINNDFFNLCENDLTEDEISIYLESMQNNKTPGIAEGILWNFLQWSKTYLSEVTKTS